MKRGHILFLQKSGLYVVPFENKGDGYTCVIVKGSIIYPVGDYHIFVHNSEIDKADRYGIDDEGKLFSIKIDTTPMKVEWETEWDCVSKGCTNKTDDPIFSLCDIHRK